MFRRIEVGDAIILVTSADAHSAIANELGVDVADLAIAHDCPHCGSDSHGRPSISAPSARRAMGLSIAHHGDVDLIALREAGAIGVDVEAIDRFAADRFAIGDVRAVLLHPNESAPAARDLARLWTAKEAILKLAGTGLRVEPRGLRIEGDRLIEWPPELGIAVAPGIHWFEPTEGLVAAVAF